MSKRILVVDDEETLCEALKFNLEAEGYCVDTAHSAEEALCMDLASYNLFLLDVMMGEISGIQLANILKSNPATASIPIIFCTAMTDENDMVNGLYLGADDYITKPFEPEEVLARIEAALRRVGKEATNDKPLTHRALTLSPSLRKATLAGQELALTAHEFDILELLMRQPEKVYTRESLYEQVWHGGYYGENNTVNVHVSNIRKKLKAIDPDADYIQTVYGIGFKLQ